MERKILKIWFFLLGIGVSLALPSLGGVQHFTTVIIRGEKLSPLLGKPISSLLLCRYEGGRFFPVTLQVDERDDEGKLLLGGSEKAGFLRPNDELIFLLEEGGKRAPASALSSLCSPVFELKVRGRYFYLFPSLSSSQREVKKVISSYARGNFFFVRTPSYSAALAKDRYFLVELAFPSGRNILDRSKIRIKARLKWWFFYPLAIKPMVKTEGDIAFRTRGIRRGPLRITVVGKPELKVVGRKVPSGEVEIGFYPEGIVFPIVVSSPIRLARYCSSASFRTSLDFASSASGMEIYLPGGYHGIADGKMEPGEKDFPHCKTNFVLLSGEKGVLLFFIRPERRAKMLPHSFYFADDGKKRKLPEGEPGSFPELGFSFDILKAEPGEYILYQYLYFFPPKTKISEISPPLFPERSLGQEAKIRFFSP